MFMYHVYLLAVVKFGHFRVKFHVRKKDFIVLNNFKLFCMIVSLRLLGVLQKRWAQKEQEMRESLKKMKAGPSSDFVSILGKQNVQVVIFYDNDNARITYFSTVKYD
jgi:hypothetical protein